jgi:hypothetical protein
MLDSEFPRNNLISLWNYNSINIYDNSEFIKEITDIIQKSILQNFDDDRLGQQTGVKDGSSTTCNNFIRLANTCWLNDWVKSLKIKFF